MTDSVFKSLEKNVQSPRISPTLLPVVGQVRAAEIEFKHIQKRGHRHRRWIDINTAD